MEENFYDPTSLGFSYLHKGFPDDRYPPHDYIDEILDFVEFHLDDNGKVLIHCSMGVSRSPGIAIAWILKINPEWNWKDAFSYVSKSKFVAPAIEIRNSVIDYIMAYRSR